MIETRQARLTRRVLTKKRLVNSIDTALDPENYNVFPIPEEERTFESRYKIDRNADNDIVYNWTNKPPDNRGQIGRSNIIRGPCGKPTPRARNTETPREAFLKFFTNEMITLVVAYTNEKISKFIAPLPKPEYYMKLVNESEILAFIGLFLYRGLYQQNNMAITTLFSDDFGPPMYAAVMSRVRYEFILRNLAFDDIVTRDERWKNDRFTAIRELFELFNKQCMTMITPSDFLSIDETLYPMKTQISFKQYNPDKPGKYGLLFKAINDARFPYNYFATPYCGKPVEEGGVFYVQGTENLVKYMVDSFSKYQAISGRNISFDRLYTSLTIAEWLLERHHVTCLGTLQKNRKGISNEIKEMANRNALTTEIYWERQKKLAMMSYVVKTAGGKKNVLMLTSLNPLLGTTIDDKKVKPAPYKLYDFTKGGTDIVDQRMEFYSCKPKSRRWPIVATA